MPVLVAALEWAAFLASMLCVFCYGHSKRQGAVVGIVIAVLFIIWGLASGVLAAAATNVFFLALHGRNLKRSFDDARRADLPSAQGR